MLASLSQGKIERIYHRSPRWQLKNEHPKKIKQSYPEPDDCNNGQSQNKNAFSIFARRFADVSNKRVTHSRGPPKNPTHSCCSLAFRILLQFNILRRWSTCQLRNRASMLPHPYHFCRPACRDGTCKIQHERQKPPINWANSSATVLKSYQMSQNSTISNYRFFSQF